MNPAEWDEYMATFPAPEPESLHVDEIGHADRTLAYGYTLERDTWHAYVLAGEVHVVIYDIRNNASSYMHGKSLPIADLKPSKCVYPNACELAFSQLMRARGHKLRFTGSVLEETYKPRALTDRGYVGHTHLDVY